jgi:hypothetical protein
MDAREVRDQQGGERLAVIRRRAADARLRRAIREALASRPAGPDLPDERAPLRVVKGGRQ